MLSRRRLLWTCSRCAPGGAALALAPFAWPPPPRPPFQAPGVAGHPARYWVSSGAAGAACSGCHLPGQALPKTHAHKPGGVKCLLCAQGCSIDPGGTGRCRARANIGGELRSLVYGRPLAIAVDPIEKKPFYHFLPGSDAYSFGTSGCPLRCRFCQNWELSQSSPGDFEAPYTGAPELVRTVVAKRAHVLAFTYNEPTVFAEYLLDVAAEARRHGVRPVMVSCGFMTQVPLADMCRALSAIKIDLKGFSEAFYRDVCGARLAPVLRSIAQVAASRTHLEIVNLVVPTLNDSEKALSGLANWVVRELGRDVPLHFTRFHPEYQLLNLPPTPVATLERARGIAMAAGIRYAYVGNVPGHAGNHTYCPGCRKAVIRRDGFFVTENNLRAGTCGSCGHAVAGVWV